MIVNEYYIYAYLDPRKPGSFTYDNLDFNFEPFYIGKGKGNRYLKHLQNIRTDHNTLKKNKIDKIIRLGLKPIIIKIYTNLSESDAYLKESDTIKKIGRLDLNSGTLSNLNDGGTGGCGNPSNDLRFKYGSGTRGKSYVEIYGVKKSDELKEKRSLSNKNRNVRKNIDRSKRNNRLL